MLSRLHKKRNHRLSVVQVATLILSLSLSGCTPGAVAGKTASALGTPAGTGAPNAAVLTRTELNLYIPGSLQKDQALVEKAINDRLLEKINCTLNLKITDWNLWASKYPILLSSGEPVDLMFSASYFNYLQEVAKNSFLPLDGLLAEFGQDIPGVMLDGYLEAARVKGKLYAIPVNKDTGQGWGIVANKEMADTAGISLDGVSYLEDLEPMLRKAKETFPEDIVPLFLSADLSMSQISGSTKACSLIGLKDRSRFVQLESGLYYDTLEQQALPMYRIPEFIDQCRLVRSWFRAGYINDDVTTTQMTSREAMSQGKAFIHVQAQSPIHLGQWENETGKELLSVEFIPSVKETQSMTGALVVLPRVCRDPERAMMLINLFWTDKTLKNLYTWGIEGTHYARDHDNVIRLPDNVKTAADTGYNPGNFWHFGNAYLLDVWNNEDPKKWELLRTYCDNMPKSALLGFSFDTTPIRQEIAAHANVITEMYPMLINGVLDTDTLLARIDKADREAGVDRVCAEITRQVKAWMADRKKTGK